MIYGDDHLLLMLEMNRMGVGTVEELAFATGDFTANIRGQLYAMMDAKAVVSVGGPENNYSVTAEGLIALYSHILYLKSRENIYRHGRCELRIKLKQRCGLNS